MKLTSRAKFVIVIVLVFMGSAIAFATTREVSDFPSGKPGDPVTIAVTSGESGAEIALDLAKNGVILKSKSFLSLALSDSRARGISPGDHTISTHITSKEALAQLLDPQRNKGLLRVPEGSTYADVLKLLKGAGVLGKSTKRPTEGELFPATYAFATGTTIDSALSQMREKFATESKRAGLGSGYGKYSGYDVLKVASLIQIEADPADFAKAARVIYNRLAIGMPLQLNSTVQYAINTRGHITLTRKQTQTPSAYNTYLHTGLPPTPISNPGIEAINAALHPETGDWLYFITVKPHETRFTKSFKEFDGWVTLYNNNVANGLFK
jgi:UPF0755 protein